MSTLICSFDGLHDNRVLRYYADFEAHILHMDTQTETGEKVSLHFTGLLAHWFENVVQDNILFGMDEITLDGFFEQYKDLLGGTISYGFPACCSIEELRERMDREHIRVFVSDSFPKRIIEKYTGLARDGHVFPVPSNGSCNKILKDIGRQCGFTTLKVR